MFTKKIFNHCSISLSGGGALVVWLAISALAQSVYAFQYPTRTYTELDGLPNTEIWSVVQDKERLLWFSARGIVASYDGLEWEHYLYPDRMPVKNIIRLTIDQEGNAWGINSVLQVCKHTSEGWKLFSFEQRHPVYDEPIVVSQFQVVELNGEQTVIIASPMIGLLIYQDGEWVSFGEKQSGADRVYAVLALGDSLLIGSDQGLACLKEGTLITYPDAVTGRSSRAIYGLAIDSSQAGQPCIWSFGKDWVGQLDGSRVKVLRSIPAFPAEPIRNIPPMLPDGGGGVFFGYNFISYQYLQNGCLHAMGPSSGLAAQGYTGASRDHEGGYWFATVRGATRIPSLRFQNYSTQDGLLDDEVTAIAQDSQGNMYFGHNAGITINTGHAFKRVTFSKSIQNFSNARVMDFEFDADGNLLAAISIAGLAKVDVNGGIEYINCSECRSLNALGKDSHGQIYIGTGSGLSLLKNNRIVPDPRLQDTTIRNISVTQDDELLLSTLSGGLIWVTGDQVRFIQSTSSPDLNAVYCATKNETTGQILVGTLTGLAEVQGDSLAPYRINHTQIDRPVYFLVCDHLDRLWIGTDNGVYRWDGEHVVHFTVYNGLAGMEVNRAAGFIDENDLLWIGTNSGLSRYLENNDRNPWEFPDPEVQILSITTNGILYSPNESIVLPAKFDLSFKYRAISFLDERQPFYEITLVKHGSSKTSTVDPHSRYMHFSNLSGGKYHLEIQAIDAWGRVSQPVKSNTFKVNRPIYLQIWFLILMGIGVIGGILFLINYISTRKYSQSLQSEVMVKTRELREAMDKYRNLVERAVLGIFRADNHGRILEGNIALVEMLGLAEREDLNKLSLENDVFVDNAHWKQLLESSSSFGVFEGVETEWKRQDGEIIIVRLGGRILQTKNDHQEIEVIAEDVTEQKLTSEKMLQAQRLESVGMLAGGIAHDFNNMLGAIMGNAELAKSASQMDSSVQKSLSAIVRVSEKAAELTRQLLAYSGQGRYVIEPVDISEHLREMLQLIRVSIPKHVKVTMNLEEDLPRVTADKAQLQQVTLNLITNAAEAIGEEEGSITVSTTVENFSAHDLLGMTNGNEAEPGEFICMQVSDTGSGMSEETLSKIFEPFFTTKFTGRGLGLSAMMGIIHAHHGAINVISQLQKGTTFQICLPVDKQNGMSNGAADQAERKKASVVTVSSSENNHIMIVDDDTAVLEVAVRMLKVDGYDITTALNGEEAIRIFSADPNRFDLLLLDNHMPKGDAPKVLEEIRKVNQTLPVLIISGDGAIDMNARFKDLNVSGLLLKPFKMRDLREQVRMIVGE